MLETLKFGEGNWANKTDSTLAYSDQYGNFQAIPFDFTRATTATRVNKQGLIESVNEGIARIDYSDSTQGALLLEQQRTNLITYSEDFSQWTLLSAGTGANPIVTSNNAISPDGTQNATKIVFDKGASSSDSDYSLIRFDNGIADIDGTASIYLRSDVNVDIELSPDFNNYTTLNVTTEWQRFTVSDSTSDRLNMGLRGTYPSNNTATVYAWGAQLEQGSYPTSYIPTQGSTVTRVAETCEGAGNNQVFNSTEGVLYFEGSVLNNDLTYRQISLAETPSGNDVLTLDYSSISNGIRTYFRVNGVAYSLNYVLTNSTEKAKIAVRYTDTLSLWVNGVQVASTPTPAVSTNFDNLSFHNGSGGGNFYGNTKDLRVYNTALTDAQLQTLTTI